MNKGPATLFSSARNDLVFEPSPGDGAGVFLYACHLLVFAVLSKCVRLACGGGAPGWLRCVPLFFLITKNKI